MSEDKNKKKGFFAKFIDSLDKKMEDKAKQSNSCCNGSCDPKENTGESKKC